jgi:hypothetical protein
VIELGVAMTVTGMRSLNVVVVAVALAVAA